MSVTPKNIIDDLNLSTLLEAIFQTVENNYIRRSVHEQEIADINTRIDELDALFTYQFTYDSSSRSLYLTTPDEEDVTAEVNQSGNLMVTLDDEDSSTLEHFSFSSSTDDLLLTVSLHSS